MKHPDRYGVLGLVVVLAVAACSTGESVDTTDESTVVTTVVPSTVPTTTAPPPTTTTSTAPTTTLTTSPPTTVGSINDQAGGSGCTPGVGTLPDGYWFGEVANLDANGVSFDLACWFTGDAAVVASAEDGEESPPPNDYYVRNLNPQLRQLDVDPLTPVTWFPDGDPVNETLGVFSDWVGFANSRGFFFGIWVTIENGEVVSILEQWVP